MKDYIRERVIEVANYMIESKETIRRAAIDLGISKSTVHRDLTVLLPLIDAVKAEEVKKILKINKMQCHSRGGRANRLKHKDN